MDCNKIEWVFIRNPIGDKEIREVEAKLGIEFPNDYKKCIEKYHGGRPRPKVFDFEEREGAVFNRLLTFDPDDDYYYIPAVRDMIEDRLISDIYPFGADPFGNFICFDYREGTNKPPKVVFWDHETAYDSPEKAISFICDSFTKLISKLYSR
jgi:cell wall assembly regulator SMI1